MTLSFTHNSNVLLIFLTLKLYIPTVTIPLTAYLLLLHITHHFLTFLNILHNHFHILLSSKCCREVFKHPPIVTYRGTSNLCGILKLSCPLSRFLTTLVYHLDLSAVDKIALLVLKLLTVLHTILSSLLTQPVKSSHT